MPEKFDRCVRKVKAKIKPREGSTKEQAAYAICTKNMGYKGRGKKKKNKLSEMLEEILQENKNEKIERKKI